MTHAHSLCPEASSLRSHTMQEEEEEQEQQKQWREGEEPEQVQPNLTIRAELESSWMAMEEGVRLTRGQGRAGGAGGAGGR